MMSACADMKERFRSSSGLRFYGRPPHRPIFDARRCSANTSASAHSKTLSRKFAIPETFHSFTSTLTRLWGEVYDLGWDKPAVPKPQLERQLLPMPVLKLFRSTFQLLTVRSARLRRPIKTPSRNVPINLKSKAPINRGRPLWIGNDH
jgi:hypothetical protein